MRDRTASHQVTANLGCVSYSTLQTMLVAHTMLNPHEEGSRMSVTVDHEENSLIIVSATVIGWQ